MFHRVQSQNRSAEKMISFGNHHNSLLFQSSSLSRFDSHLPDFSSISCDSLDSPLPLHADELRACYKSVSDSPNVDRLVDEHDLLESFSKIRIGNGSDYDLHASDAFVAGIHASQEHGYHSRDFVWNGEHRGIENGLHEVIEIRNAGNGTRADRSGYLLQQKSGQREAQIPSINDFLLCSLQQKKDHKPGEQHVDSINYPQVMMPRLDCNSNAYKNLMLNGNAINDIPASTVSRAESCNEEEMLNSYLLQSTDPYKGHKNNTYQNSIAHGDINQCVCCTFHGGVYGNGCNTDNLRGLRRLDEVSGYVSLIAQDQNGCRLLQRVFEKGSERDVQIIFDELIHHVVELMLKPFGNYVIQKLLDVCNEDQRLQIVLMVTKEPARFLEICLNTYGTRVIQKLIETLKTRSQIMETIVALKSGFLELIKDQNGNHVIQRCLQCFDAQDSKFIFEAAARHCVEIATHRHGCCVMQRCIAHSVANYRDKLLTEISTNGLLLAQDPFGNYVVQYIIELKYPYTVSILLSQFKGHYVHLATQKFSSHVVEKCLQHFEASRSQIVRELISVCQFEQLLQDPFANYVIQSALSVTKGHLHAVLVEAVRPHAGLRTNPYCKRIFSRNLLKK